MRKRKPIIHSEKFLTELLKNEAVKRRYHEDYEKLLVAHQTATLRKVAKMTQDQMSSKLGTTQSVVSRIETGRQNLTLGMIRKIAKVFHRKVLVTFE